MQQCTGADTVFDSTLLGTLQTAWQVVAPEVLAGMSHHPPTWDLSIAKFLDWILISKQDISIPAA